tara:strand:+ start:117 stop:296 length:180 start_codon:yes stop_codon:yes gene_type:complete
MSQPIKGEKKDTFLDRCMIEQERVDSFPDESQRYAVCQRVWETHAREAMTKYVNSLKKK